MYVTKNYEQHIQLDLLKGNVLLRILHIKDKMCQD